MKGIIEFNLDDEDDQRALLRCNKSLDMALILWEIRYNLKRKMEYLNGFDTMSSFEALDTIFEKICDEMNERGIVLDDMIV